MIVIGTVNGATQNYSYGVNAREIGVNAREIRRERHNR